MLVVFGYLLLISGAVLSALGFVNFLLGTGPIVGTGSLGSLSTAVSLQAIVVGLAAAGLGLALLRLRRLKLAEGGRLEEGSGTGWAFLIGALVGASVVGGGLYLVLDYDAEPAGMPADTAVDTAPVVDTPSAGARPSGGATPSDSAARVDTVLR